MTTQPRAQLDGMSPMLFMLVQSYTARVRAALSGLRTLDTGTSSAATNVKEDKMKRVLALASALVVLGLTGTISAEAATTPAPCTLGALNMVHDATMLTIPMTHDAPQGNTGMFIAVGVSGCK